MNQEKLYLTIKDPSGEIRKIQIHQTPFSLGTRYGDRQGLRDSKINLEALVIELKDRWILKSTQEGLSIGLGELRFPSIEIPFGVPLKVGDTELVFDSQESRRHRIRDPLLSDCRWKTEAESGVQMLKDLSKASQSRLSIYLSGETGTGKELLAEQIHQWSDRASGPYIPINCGALPVSLAESELFGHVKGAFTGSVRDRVGALLQAHNGTLFLDEVGDLPIELQVKLLRFLESGEIRPVGSDRTLKADVRVICATHKPLSKLVQEGLFRQDLYYRLASIPIQIPNLNSRPEDIRYLASEFSRSHRKVMTEEALRRLLDHHWVGNVRELRHVVERACGIAGATTSLLQKDDFQFLSNQGSAISKAESVIPGICTIDQMEKVLMLRALKHSRGNRTQAAKLLGIARSTLFDMIKRHKIVGPRSVEYRIEESTG